MSVNLAGYNQVYGITNGIQPVLKLPIEGLRAPTSDDAAQIGQVWVYNENVWMFVGNGVWSEIAASSSAGIFTSLTVNGSSSFNGGVAMVTGNNPITIDSGTAATNIGTDSAAKTITIGNAIGATEVIVASGTGGIELNTNNTGNLNVDGAVATTFAGSFTVTLNARVGVVKIAAFPGGDVVTGTGFTLVLNNSFIGYSTVNNLTAYNFNISNNGAYFNTLGINIVSGTATIYCYNNSGATIVSGVDNICIAFNIAS